jgi:hypothetical protein
VSILPSQTNARRVPNRPFNDEGELFATGSALDRGWSGPVIDNHGGMEVTVGNARLLDGKNVIRLWNHSKDRAQFVELPVHAVWYSANNRKDLLVKAYLSPHEVLRLKFASGDDLALQGRSGPRATWPENITLCPVFCASEVIR